MYTVVRGENKFEEEEDKRGIEQEKRADKEKMKIFRNV